MDEKRFTEFVQRILENDNMPALQEFKEILKEQHINPKLLEYIDDIIYAFPEARTAARSDGIKLSDIDRLRIEAKKRRDLENSYRGCR